MINSDKAEKPPTFFWRSAVGALLLFIPSSCAIDCQACCFAESNLTISLSAPQDSLQFEPTNIEVQLDNDQLLFQINAIDSSVEGGDGVALAFCTSPFATDLLILKLSPNQAIHVTRKRDDLQIEVPLLFESKAIPSQLGYAAILKVSLSSLRLQMPEFDGGHFFLSIQRHHVNKSAETHWSYWRLPHSIETREFHPSSFCRIDLSKPLRHSQSTETQSERVRSLVRSEMVLRKEQATLIASPITNRQTRQWYDNLGPFPEPEKWLCWSFFPKSKSRLSSFRSDPDQKPPAELWGNEFAIRAEFEVTTDRTQPLHLELSNKFGETLRIWRKEDRFQFLFTKHQSPKVWFASDSSSFREDSIQEVVFSSEGSTSGLGWSLFVNGKPVSTQALNPDLMSDPNKPDERGHSIVEVIPNQWTLAATPNVKELQFFSTGLTKLEAISFMSNAQQLTWDELSVAEQLNWIDHFANRVDLNGRYLAESIRHYGAALAKESAQETKPRQESPK